MIFAVKIYVRQMGKEEAGRWTAGHGSFSAVDLAVLCQPAVGHPHNHGRLSTSSAPASSGLRAALIKVINNKVESA
jgi:hypothetical protein